MSLIFKKIAAVCVAVGFLTASLYCFCFSTIQLSKHKHTCCDTKSSSGKKTSDNDCPHCHSSFNAEARTNDADHIQPMAAALLHVAFERTISHAPVVLGKSLFINGPPGLLHIVPLYIQNQTLRL